MLSLWLTAVWCYPTTVHNLCRLLHNLLISFTLTTIMSLVDLLNDWFACSENVPHDFDCHLEIYAYEHHEDLTIASTQVKLKKRISDISNTVGRRLSGLSLVIITTFYGTLVCCFLAVSSNLYVSQFFCATLAPISGRHEMVGFLVMETLRPLNDNGWEMTNLGFECQASRVSIKILFLCFALLCSLVMLWVKFSQKSELFWGFMM